MEQRGPSDVVRCVLGVCWRPTLSFVERQGLLTAVRLHLPDETSRLIAEPPPPWSWVDAQHFDALYVALAGLSGDREMLRALGREVAAETTSSVLAYMLRTLLALIDGSPRAMFTNLGRLGATVSRPWNMRWVPESARAGVVELQFPTDIPPQQTLDVMEGSFQHLLALTTPGGFVGDRSVSQQDSTVRIYVRW